MTTFFGFLGLAAQPLGAESSKARLRGDRALSASPHQEDTLCLLHALANADSLSQSSWMGIPKRTDLEKSAEWMAEGTYRPDSRKFERMRRLNSRVYKDSAYGYLAMAAILVLTSIFLLIVALAERFG